MLRVWKGLTLPTSTTYFHFVNFVCGKVCIYEQEKRVSNIRIDYPVLY